MQWAVLPLPGSDLLVVEELGEGGQLGFEELEGEVHQGVEDPRTVGPDRVGNVPARKVKKPYFGM